MLQEEIMIKRILTIVALLVLSTTLSAQAMMLSLSPVNGDVHGYPGTTVGWGYTVTNDSPTDWIVLSASDFTPPPPSWGTYTDFIQNYFVLLAPAGSPGDTWTEFNAQSQTGTGSFLIDPQANPGDTATGNIIISFDRYDGDPTNGGNYIDAATVFASASVTVDPVPEPSTFFLLGGGLAGLFWSRRKSRSV
jgi:hypothetical protein